jgi:hypothetical protein
MNILDCAYVEEKAFDLRSKPKWFLKRLYDTASATAYDSHLALQEVRDELRPEWAHVCDPTLLTREADLVAQLSSTMEWQLRLLNAMKERRVGLQRIAAGDVLDGEP